MRRTLSICRLTIRLEVLSTINLNRQSALLTIEIQVVRTHRDLPPKLRA